MRRLVAALRLVSRKRAFTAAMLRVEVSPRLPQFREELFIKRGLEITNAFGTAGSSFGAHHSFNHLDVVRSPEGKILIVFNQGFR